MSMSANFRPLYMVVVSAAIQQINFFSAPEVVFAASTSFV